ncbi:MAG: FHA domain-containing protein [Lachnospiraceae bacterium]|nr:FHA domain-containing protein [Lachnospiraceae bacterium]
MSRISLYGVGGVMAGSIFPLEEAATLIGRDPSKCSIVYPADEPGISTVHCQVIPRGNYLEVMDMGSSYGTFLENGIRMQKNESYQLSNGDRFYLGDRKNKYIVKVM